MIETLDLCMPHRPKFSDFFNLCLHLVFVICGQNHQIFINGDQSGKEMIIRTIENVNDFSDIRHSYLKNLSASTKKRQEKLLQDHYFLCECTRCLDTKSDELKNSLKCGSANCSGCVPVTTGNCIEKGNLFKGIVIICIRNL